MAMGVHSILPFPFLALRVFIQCENKMSDAGLNSRNVHSQREIVVELNSILQITRRKCKCHCAIFYSLYKHTPIKHGESHAAR
jgi:hypothetical protein